MKSFFKILLSSILGIIVGLLLIFGIIIGIVSVSGETFELKNNAVFHLKLHGEIVDRSTEDIYSNWLFDGEKAIGLDDILESIKKAKNNDNIKGILLDVDFAQIGVSSAREIRNALIDFKESGKFLISNSGAYMQTLYYTASVADKIVLNPSGIIEFRGLASTPVFYKNALDKLGIEMQLIKVGTYKSFAEKFTNTEMSDENKMQVTDYLHSTWNSMLDEISVSRKIEKEDLNRYADEMMAFQLAEKAIQYKLADTLLYNDEIDNLLKTELNLSQKEDIQLVELANMKDLPDTKKEYAKEKIAIVYAVGDIDGASSGSGGINSKELVETLKNVREDSLVKAVVLRINSPGGSAYGSEQIWRAVSLLKKEKPIIVSMGDYAASGGYYIACEADVIVAQPTTLTGSIGIFGIIPNVKGLTDKLGITYDIVKTNEKADMPAMNRPFTADEHEVMQAYVNHGYEIFVKRCADGRNKTTDEIKAIAEGRVWTGARAIEIGLVDELGGLEKAIEIAQKQASLNTFRITEYPKKKSFMEKLMENTESNIQEKLIKMQLGENYRHFINLKNIENLRTIQAVMPFDIIVK